MRFLIFQIQIFLRQTNAKKSYWSGLICWELAFNATFVNRAKDTSFIIHSSNDSWYGQSMPEQHLKLARARAVESNKWVARSTTLGISQIISPNKKNLLKSLKRCCWVHKCGDKVK